MWKELFLEQPSLGRVTSGSLVGGTEDEVRGTRRGVVHVRHRVISSLACRDYYVTALGICAGDDGSWVFVQMTVEST